MSDHPIAEARARIRAAARVVVLTGAGISAESGVPTFRGEQGLWRRHRPEELATREAFDRDPALVWEWYAMRRAKLSAAEPNRGHEALARFALAREGVRIATQNVDGLHGRAARAAAESVGAVDPSPALPLELHGSIFRLRCTGCGRREENASAVGGSGAGLPRCLECDALLRPDVVWFGESLDAGVLGLAFASARDASVCLVVGTSAVVHPAASIPLATLRSGGQLIEVNPEGTALSSLATVRIGAGAASALPRILLD